MTTTRRLSLAYLALTAGLAVLFALNLFWGSVELKPGAVAAALLGRGGDALAVGIVLQLRLPRAVMVVLLGAALSAAGYLLQTFFANPIAGPFVMGVSSGAKLAVALTMVVFLQRGLLTGSVTGGSCGRDGGDGFRAGGGPAGAPDEHPCHLRHHDRLHLLGHHRHRRDLRAGLQHRQPPQLVDGQLFRHDVDQRGRCGLRGAARTGSGIPPLLAHGGLPDGGKLCPKRRRAGAGLLDGPRALSSLLSACVTAFAGPISLVGIAVPHLVKSLLGSAKPLYVLPGCCLGGAAFCLLCDLIARSLFAPTELSISSVTAVFGAPVVIWLLVRRQTEGGRE